MKIEIETAGYKLRRLLPCICGGEYIHFENLSGYIPVPKGTGSDTFIVGYTCNKCGLTLESPPCEDGFQAVISDDYGNYLKSFWGFNREELLNKAEAWEPPPYDPERDE